MGLGRIAAAVAAAATLAVLAVALIIHIMAGPSPSPSPSPPPPSLAVADVANARLEVSVRAISVNSAERTSAVLITISASRQISVDRIVLLGATRSGTLVPLNCTVAPPPPVNITAEAAQVFTANCTGIAISVAVYHGDVAVMTVVT